MAIPDIIATIRPLVVILLKSTKGSAKIASGKVLIKFIEVSTLGCFDPLPASVYKPHAIPDIDIRTNPMREGVVNVGNTR